VVGQAATCESAFALATELRPDVIVFDVSGAVDDPARAVRLLLAAPGHAQVIVLSRQDNTRVMREVLYAGAVCYLPKNTRGHHLIRTVRAVHQGEVRSFLDPVRSDRLPLPVPYPVPAVTRSPDSAAPLTQREREVLELVARARSNRQIGAQLHITEGTVKRHLRNIFGKLGAVSRIDAVNKALAAMLIQPPVVVARAFGPGRTT
jgi:DNA-binding NarL/FixJ family response regulator